MCIFGLSEYGDQSLNVITSGDFQAIFQDTKPWLIQVYSLSRTCCHVMTIILAFILSFSFFSLNLQKGLFIEIRFSCLFLWKLVSLYFSCLGQIHHLFCNSLFVGMHLSLKNVLIYI